MKEIEIDIVTTEKKTLKIPMILKNEAGPDWACSLSRESIHRGCMTIDCDECAFNTNHVQAFMEQIS